MSKRLTAEEVLTELSVAYGHHVRWSGSDTSKARLLRSICDAIGDNLIPQWQDEPDGDGGLVWVRFADEEKNSHRWALPYVTWKEDGEWWIEGWDEFTMRLDGRQVCPITPRPKD